MTFPDPLYSAAADLLTAYAVPGPRELWEMESPYLSLATDVAFTTQYEVMQARSLILLRFVNADSQGIPTPIDSKVLLAGAEGLMRDELMVSELVREEVRKFGRSRRITDLCREPYGRLLSEAFRTSD